MINNKPEITLQTRYKKQNFQFMLFSSSHQATQSCLIQCLVK